MFYDHLSGYREAATPFRLLLSLLLTTAFLTGMSQDILQLSPQAPDVRIPYGDDPLQFGYLRLPKGSEPFPAVIVIHGGFWRAAYNLDHISHLAAALRDAGVGTWSIEYRRIGDEGGAWPGTFQDVARGVDHLKVIAAQYKLDLQRVIAIGHSA